MKHRRPIILIHGGAGVSAMSTAQRRCLQEALGVGYRLLDREAAAVDAVEASIRVLEQSGLFNAGVGSRHQLDGVVRMDASIMEGRCLTAGAVASLEDTLHPISAARLVMRETTHVLLVGPHATRFARYFKLERLSRQTAKGVRRRRPVPVTTHGLKTSALFRAMTRYALDLCDKHGRETVGAVALDRSGTVAAGASTGGIDIMLPGRVGDTPLIGCGVYADNQGGAVSMTGWGESIIRMAVAKAIMDHLISGKTPAVAVQHVLKTLVLRVSGAAGAIVLAPNGRMTIRHTTPRMAAGYWNGRHRPVVKDRF